MLRASAIVIQRLLCSQGEVSADQTVTCESNVLFLCMGKSARSIMAECAMNRWGKGRFRGFSAGSHPKGVVHRLTLAVLSELNYDTGDLRSKSSDEFASPGSPHFDFVFTVCDQAAAEQCPVWPGHPITAHWGIADPAALEGSDKEKRRSFSQVYRELEHQDFQQPGYGRSRPRRASPAP